MYLALNAATEFPGFKFPQSRLQVDSNIYTYILHVYMFICVATNSASTYLHMYSLRMIVRVNMFQNGSLK